MKMLIKNEGDFTIVIVDNNHHQRLDEARKERSSEFGKYLLFAEDREVLLEAARDIVKKFVLSEFHVSNVSNNNGSFSYVCKIYDNSNVLATSIEMFLNQMNYGNIEYRYFKQEWKSQAGIYSEQYLKTKGGSHGVL